MFPYIPSRPSPAYFPRNPYLPRIPMFFGPAFGLLNTALLISGMIAIGSVVAPEAVERAIPGWRGEFGLLVIVGVALGLLRSVWRLFIPILGVAFWIVAVMCIWKPNLAALPALPIPSLAQSQHVQAAPVSSEVKVRSSLPPALPNEAYFPSQGGSFSGGNIGGSIQRLIKRSVLG